MAESSWQLGRAEDHKVIVQISDVHVLASALLHDRVDAIGNLERILAAVELGSGAPDLLLFSGDLADKGEPEAYLQLKATVEPFAKRLGVPVMYVPGNHDERRAFREHLLGWDANDEPIDQVLWCGGLRVIALDSTVPGSHHGDLDAAQLDHLDRQLQEAAPLGTILVIHHPPIPGPSAFLNQLTLREPERLAKVILGSDVKMLLAGHTHHVSAGILGGVPVWVATASAYQLDVLASTSRSLRGLQGSAFSHIDVMAEGTVATNISVVPPEALVYEIDFETIKRFMEKGASVPEANAVFEHSEH